MFLKKVTVGRSSEGKIEYDVSFDDPIEQGNAMSTLEITNLVGDFLSKLQKKGVVISSDFKLEVMNI